MSIESWYVTATSGALALSVAGRIQSQTTMVTRPWELLEARVHLNGAGGAGNLTATLDSRKGSTYDVVLDTEDMTALTDYHWQPTRPICFSSSDILKFAWANAGNKTYGLEVVIRIY